MPGVVINFQTTIKDHCIINTSSSIDHDCFVDSFVNLSPGVNIERLDLLNVNYREDTLFSHFGHENRNWEKIEDI